MKHPMTKLGAIAAAFAMVAVWSVPAAAQGGPVDLTGLWTTYSAGGGRGGGGFRGFGGRGGGPMYTDDAQAQMTKYRQAIAGTNESPGAYCVGTGMPGSMMGSGGYPMEIVQHPKQINITYEAHMESRRIYMDGRVKDLSTVFPERDGFSVGHWEGNTLVVETSKLVEQIDQSYAHSDQAKIVERYSVETQDDGTRVLTDEWTMTDPVFLKEPFTATKRWQQVPDGRILNYECTEPDWLDVLDKLMSDDGADSAK